MTVPCHSCGWVFEDAGCMCPPCLSAWKGRMAFAVDSWAQQRAEPDEDCPPVANRKPARRDGVLSRAVAARALWQARHQGALNYAEIASTLGGDWPGLNRFKVRRVLQDGPGFNPTTWQSFKELLQAEETGQRASGEAKRLQSTYVYLGAPNGNLAAAALGLADASTISKDLRQFEAKYGKLHIPRIRRRGEVGSDSNGHGGPGRRAEDDLGLATDGEPIRRPNCSKPETFERQGNW